MPKKSISPLSGMSFVIPRDTDEAAIDTFLSRQSEKKVVVVQGLGFVGAMTSLVVANAARADYAVIGVDTATPESYWKIGSLNSGIFPIQADDKKIEELFENTKFVGNLMATHDSYAFSVADVIVVDINLDVQKKCVDCHDGVEFDVRIEEFVTALTPIARACRDDVLILIETTVPPGTCQNIVLPLFRRQFQLRGLKLDNLSIAHSYERVMPGPDYVDSMLNCPRVYAGIDDRSSRRAGQFLSTFIGDGEKSLRMLKSTTASEMAKVLENSYRAVNIAFMIEWSRFAEAAGVSLYDIISVIKERPTHSNIMSPGIGVGGYCLTKDPLLASWAFKNYFDSNLGVLKFSEQAVAFNDRMPSDAASWFSLKHKKIKGEKILVCGVTYRGDVNDTRFSPVKSFVEHLLALGANPHLHDPYVTDWKDVNLPVINKLSELDRDYDAIIFCAAHSFYTSKVFLEYLEDITPTKLFDTVGLLVEMKAVPSVAKHQVSTLGCG